MRPERPQPRRRRLRLRNRWRLTFWIVAVVTAIVLGAGVATVLLVENRFTSTIDDELRRDVGSTVTAFEVLGDELLQELAAFEPDELVGSAHATVVLSNDGVEFSMPSSSGDEPDPLPDLDGVSAATLRAEAGEVFEVPAVGGDFDYRAIAAQLADGQVLVVAAPLDELDEAIRSMVGVFVLVAVVAAVVMIVVIALVSAYVTRPLDGMIATAEEIGSGTFDTRIDSDGTEDVDRLASALNAMLDRVQGALDDRDQSEATLRRFIADASHELRTPLAAIIGYTELHLTRMATSPEQADRSFTRINAEAERMHRLVEDLLALARLDQQPLAIDEPVDLIEVVATAVSDARTIDASRPITLATPPSAVVRGDAALLRQAVDNLLANTRAHTPPGTAVSVTVAVDVGSVQIVVADDGPGIDPDELPHIFERFHRTDPARARSGGAGLGLAIVASAVDRHHGTVHGFSPEDEGMTIVIRLPT